MIAGSLRPLRRIPGPRRHADPLPIPGHHHAATIAEYGDGDAGLVLAPALDFTVDGWWHSRIAVTRGVEQGFSLVRAGQIGLMTVSDASGEVLAEDERLAVADVPIGHVETVYGKFGNWLLIPVLLILLAGIAAAVPRRKREADPEAAEEPVLASRWRTEGPERIRVRALRGSCGQPWGRTAVIRASSLRSTPKVLTLRWVPFGSARMSLPVAAWT